MGTNRIIWIPAAPGALWYDGDSIFVPRIDYLTQPPPNEFEKTGVARWIRKYHRVIDRWHYPGDHWHGDAEDFAGLSDKSKYFLPGIVPLACPPERLFGFMVLGTVVGDNEVKLRPAMRFGATVANRIETARPGFKFGMTALSKKDVVKPAVKFGLRVLKKDDVARPGLDFGIRVIDKPLPSQLARPGLDFGIRVIEIPLPSQLVKPAFQLALAMGDRSDLPKPAFKFRIAVRDHVKPTDLVKPAFRLGIDVNAKPPATEIIKPAFRFGIDVNAKPPATEIIKPAFQMGLEIVDSTPPPTPGTTCVTAADVSIGTPYTYTLPGTSTHWFRFPKGAGVEVFIHFVKNSGIYDTANGFTGSSCDSQTFRWVHGSDATFDDSFPSSGSAEYGYWMISSDVSVDCNYTFELTT